jgi:hypothetical protein
MIGEWVVVRASKYTSGMLDAVARDDDRATPVVPLQPRQFTCVAVALRLMTF